MAADIDDRLAFRTSSLHTSEGVAERYLGACRVCASPVNAGDTYRRREWGVEVAHATCGWWGRSATSLAPLAVGKVAAFERTRPGTSFRFYEWRCPTCGLDACQVDVPDGETDRRCVRCSPYRARVQVGRRVRPLLAMRVRVSNRTVTLPGDAVGDVLLVNDALDAVVSWRKPHRVARSVIPIAQLVRIP